MSASILNDHFTKRGKKMEKLVGRIFLSVLFSLCLVSFADAAQDNQVVTVKDITEDVLAGPGSVSINTNKNILMSFGAQIRMIPTSESNWDFGMRDDLTLPGYLGGKLNKSFFQDHPNESGWLNDSYIRSEDRLYFNAMPKTRKWSFYAALEFDRPLDTKSIDSRGGKTDDSSNFGLERLQGTVALTDNIRLHVGWDIWGLDFGDGGGLVYGDDNPGFWLTGKAGKLDFNIGYFKLQENNFQNEVTDLNDSNTQDRDLYAGYVTYHFNKTNKIQAFYAYDHIRGIPSGTFLNHVIDEGTGSKTMISGAKTDSHHIGAYFTGKQGLIEYFAEGVYQFGSADDTGLSATGKANDYDISAYAGAADVAINLKDMVGFTVKPHIGVLYTSGDDDAKDDNLEGYTGVENCQRFSKYWGGENTIIGDTNMVLGTMLYGYLPELYGNGTPVFTGGLQNTAGFGGGRGDNPGLTMTSVGIILIPKRFIIFRSNVNSFWWNEDIMVTSFADGATTTKVDSGYTGTEWDNELTIALDKNMFIKGQFSWFFPGSTIKDATSALTSVTVPSGPAAGTVIPGKRSDDVAMRLAAELIWKF